MASGIALALGFGWPIAALGAGDAKPVPDALACQGNEPFWGLEIDGETAQYRRLGAQAIALAGSATALDYLTEPQRVWRGRGESLVGDVVALITATPCRDTMSDREGQTAFAYDVRVSLPAGEVLVGCCRAGLRPASVNLAEPAAFPVADLRAKPADDWSRFLLDLLPAISACLDETPGPAPRVTKAWPMNHGMVGVRTRDGAGGWFACIAPALGGEVDRLEPVVDHERLPGEGIVVFTPAAQEPPAGECYEHERALGGGGELVGWLSYDTC